MEKRQRCSRWVFLSGILFTLLGIIHVAATPVIFASFLKKHLNADQLGFLYVFIATGAAVIFVGLLIMYCSRGLKTAQPWAWTISLSAGVFMMLLGTGAIFAMRDNPFAYLTLVFTIFDLLPLWLYRRELRSTSK